MEYERTPPNVANWMEYWQKRAEKAEAENAALREQLADRERDLEFEYKAREEAEANYEGMKDNYDMESCESAALRARVEELEAQLHPVGCQDVLEYYLDEDDNETISASHSEGAGGDVYPFGGKGTETR